jgi:hypothetical protein
LTVKIELRETSQPIVRDDVLNTYTKGPLYVIYREGGFVEKYPVSSLFRVTEDYSGSATVSK